MIAERTARALPIIQERSNFTRPQAVKIPGSNPALTDALPLPPEMLSLSFPQVVAQQLVTLSGSALRILHVSDTHHSQAECLNIPARYSSACDASNTRVQADTRIAPWLELHDCRLQTSLYPASGCVETTGCVRQPWIKTFRGQPCSRNLHTCSERSLAHRGPHGLLASHLSMSACQP